jgi:Fe-S cluster biosynthesis and repair protein YggX
MAHMVFCVRNKKEMEGLDEPPFDSEFGQKIYKNVSKAAWGEWVDRQKMLLNEYRLQPWTPQAQQFLVEQMEEFFFSEGSACPRSSFRRRSERQGLQGSGSTAAWARYPRIPMTILSSGAQAQGLPRVN